MKGIKHRCRRNFAEKYPLGFFALLALTLSSLLGLRWGLQEHMSPRLTANINLPPIVARLSAQEPHVPSFFLLTWDMVEEMAPDLTKCGITVYADRAYMHSIGGTGGTRGRFRSNFFDLPLVLVVPNKAKKKANSEEIQGRHCFDST